MDSRFFGISLRSLTCEAINFQPLKIPVELKPSQYDNA